MDERGTPRVCESCGEEYARKADQSYESFSARHFCSWACYLAARKAGLIPWNGRAPAAGPYRWAPGEEPPLGFCAAGGCSPVTLESGQIAALHSRINIEGNRYARWRRSLADINAALPDPERHQQAA